MIMTVGKAIEVLSRVGAIRYHDIESDLLVTRVGELEYTDWRWAWNNGSDSAFEAALVAGANFAEQVERVTRLDITPSEPTLDAAIEEATRCGRLYGSVRSLLDGSKSPWFSECEFETTLLGDAEHRITEILRFASSERCTNRFYLAMANLVRGTTARTVRIAPDFAPYSLSAVVYYHLDDEGRHTDKLTGRFASPYQFGVIYSGPGQPLDGSGPAYTVSVEATGHEHNWSTHT